MLCNSCKSRTQCISTLVAIRRMDQRSDKTFSHLLIKLLNYNMKKLTKFWSSIPPVAKLCDDINSTQPIVYNNLNHIKDIKTQPVSFQVSIFSNSELSQITNEFPLSYELKCSTLSALHC